MVVNRLVITLLLILCISALAQPNKWDTISTEATGGVNAQPVYAPNVGGFILWGYRMNTDVHYDVERFDMDSVRWYNETGLPPQPKATRYDAFPANYQLKFTLSAGNLRPKPPCPNRAGILGAQSCYVPDSGLIFYFWGRSTFVYRPVEKKWDSINTDTSGGYIKTPPMSSMGALCWDPINKEVVLFGGGYHGIGGKNFDIDFNPRATWVFSFSTREWRKLDLGPSEFNTKRAFLDSTARIARKLWSEAGQHYMGHADVFPSNTIIALKSNIDGLSAALMAYAATLSHGSGYMRQQTDSATAAVNGAIGRLNVASSQVEAGNSRDAWWASLDSAYRQLKRASEHLQVAPPARYYARMVYAGNGKIVLFGGTGDKEVYADTWVYDCATRTWEHRHPVTRPASSIGCFDYDSHNNCCLLIDGSKALWSYDVAANVWSKWVLPLPFTAWDSWNNGALYMEYDPVNNSHLVLASEQSYGDPKRRKGFTLSFDKTTAAPATAITALEWNWNNSAWNSYRSQTLADTAAWRRFLDTMPVNRIVSAVAQIPFKPDNRAYGTGTYDADRDQMILWGGGHSAYMGTDVSHFDLNTGRWHQDGPASFPPYPFGNPDGDGWSTFYGEPGSAHSYTGLGYDNRLMQMILGSRFYDCDMKEWMVSARYAGLPGSGGGYVTTTNPKWGALGLKGYHHSSTSVYLNYLDTSTLRWSRLGPLFPATVTGSTEEIRGCYDSKRDRVFLYGYGTGGNTKTNETWVFNLADSTWEKLTPAMYDSNGTIMSLDSLPPKGSYNIWYDPDNDWVFMFASHLYQQYKTVYAYNCADNYWRRMLVMPSNYGQNWGPMIKNVGYSLKKKMFVLAYAENFQDPGPIGAAFYKFDPSKLPAITTTTENLSVDGSISLDCSPNPFNPVLTLRFSVPKAQSVLAVVYDMNGRLVRKLMGGQALSGKNTLVWNGLADDGSFVGSGLYIVKLETSAGKLQRKVLLLK